MHDTDTPHAPEIARFRGRFAWRRDHGGDLFPSDASLEWFIRRHRDRLIASGQLLLRHGRGGNLVGPRFGDVALEIMREESRARAAECRDRVAVEAGR